MRVTAEPFGTLLPIPGSAREFAFPRRVALPRACQRRWRRMSQISDSGAHSSTNTPTLRDRVGSERHFKTLLSGDTRSFVRLLKRHLAACRAVYYATVKPSHAINIYRDIYKKQILCSYVCVCFSLRPLGHIPGLRWGCQNHSDVSPVPAGFVLQSYWAMHGM